MSEREWNDPSWPPRSPTPWAEYPQRDYPGERLARVEEGQRHLIDRATTNGERLHMIGNRLAAQDARMAATEAEHRRIAEIVLKLDPLAQEYQRRKDRVRFIKDLLNWLTVPAVFYLAVSGRANWAEAFAALAKLFGAG